MKIIIYIATKTSIKFTILLSVSGPGLARIQPCLQTMFHLSVPNAQCIFPALPALHRL